MLKVGSSDLLSIPTALSMARLSSLQTPLHPLSVRKTTHSFVVTLAGTNTKRPSNHQPLWLTAEKSVPQHTKAEPSLSESEAADHETQHPETTGDSNLPATTDFQKYFPKEL